MDFYFINEDYLNFLRQYENKIMYGSSNYDGDKFTLGVIIKVNSIKYYAPVSSIKNYQLKDTLNLNKEAKKVCYPIIGEHNGKDKILSTIRLDFMFPVPNTEITKLIIKNIDSKKRMLVKKEYEYIKEKQEEISEKANSIYNKAIKPTHFLHEKCCNFKLLEEKHQEWVALKEKEKEV